MSLHRVDPTGTQQKSALHVNGEQSPHVSNAPFLADAPQKRPHCHDFHGRVTKGYAKAHTGCSLPPENLDMEISFIEGLNGSLQSTHTNSHVETAKAGDVLYELAGNEAHECCLKKQASFRTTAYYHNFVRTDNECICMNECKNHCVHI